jgi:hypothetical protein
LYQRSATAAAPKECGTGNGRMESNKSFLLMAASNLRINADTISTMLIDFPQPG